MTKLKSDRTISRDEPQTVNGSEESDDGSETDIVDTGRIVFGTFDGFEYAGEGALASISENFEGVLDSIRKIRVREEAWFFFSIPFTVAGNHHRLIASVQHAKDRSGRDGYWGGGVAFHESEETAITAEVLDNLLTWAHNRNVEFRKDPESRYNQFKEVDVHGRPQAKLLFKTQVCQLMDLSILRTDKFHQFVSDGLISKKNSIIKHGIIISATQLPDAPVLTEDLIDAIIVEAEQRRNSAVAVLEDLRPLMTRYEALTLNKIKEKKQQQELKLRDEFDNTLNYLEKQAEQVAEHIDSETAPLWNELQRLEKVIFNRSPGTKIKPKSIKQLNILEEKVMRFLRTYTAPDIQTSGLEPPDLNIAYDNKTKPQRYKKSAATQSKKNIDNGKENAQSVFSGDDQFLQGVSIGVLITTLFGLAVWIAANLFPVLSRIGEFLLRPTWQS